MNAFVRVGVSNLVVFSLWVIVRGVGAYSRRKTVGGGRAGYQWGVAQVVEEVEGLEQVVGTHGEGGGSKMFLGSEIRPNLC